MRTLTEIISNKITSMPQVKKLAKEIRAKVRAVVAKYTVSFEFIQDMEEALK